MLLEAILLLLSLIIIHHVINRMKEPPGLPPGPTPLPIIGNLPNIAGYLNNMHLGFHNLTKKYGDIFTLTLQGQRVVVINSASLAREALLTKKDDFAGRPYMFTGDKFSRGGKGIAFQDFSKTLVLQRKLAHTAVRLYVSTMEPKMIKETDALIKRISDKGSAAFSPKNDITLAILNNVCAMVFGDRYDMDDPEFLRVIDDISAIGWILGSILDTFPWLYIFPIAHSKAMRHYLESRDELFDRKYREHRDTLTDGVTRDFTDALLRAKSDEAQCDSSVRKVITEDHVIMTMHVVFIAGVETTSTTLTWLIACLVRYPGIQAKLHEELDKAIGQHRKPDLSDKENLPYMEACIAEVLRFITVGPLLVPHKATRDSSLHGYHIPKGTTVIVNAWAIHRDEKEWRNPHEFDPTRFLTSDGKCDTTGSSFIPFGAGRRVCVGEAMAKRLLFIMAARLFHQFEFTNPPNNMTPDLEGFVGLVNCPRPFEIIAKNRLS